MLNLICLIGLVLIACVVKHYKLKKGDEWHMKHPCINCTEHWHAGRGTDCSQFCTKLKDWSEKHVSDVREEQNRTTP